ncbi:MAG TPA: uroporphyrinogen-III C-methyltransferase [Burkholderiales bacterium]|nr:uroporphyrinogen-III C-methyltransferase [Burkholderiales bacterium]
MSRGKVTLVGAGPGDPELLTLKAVRAIREAEVILVDDLVHRDVLAHAATHARVIRVGKRGGCASTPQAYIERLMIAEARAGKRVVRLKGGDPCMFGRGGEEVAALADAGIEADVVNGITSGLAAATSAGIALTHREHAHGVAFVTGHAASGAGPDWNALVRSRLTLVIYMGVSRCAELQQSLLEAGMASDMPVVIVQNASRDDERRIASRLHTLATDVRAHEVASPAILIAGRAAALAAERLYTTAYRTLHASF